MADLKISALTGASTPLAGTEVLPIVQSSTTKKVSIANLTAGRDVSTANLFAVSPDGTKQIALVPSNTTNQILGDYNSGGNIPLQIGLYTIPAMLKFETTGDVTVKNNLVIGTSGKGIDFSATAGTGTSELLADYEEGTWTAKLYDASNGGNASATTATGYYTKIGNQVTLTVGNFNNIDTTGMTGGNFIRLGDLPFTPISNSSGSMTVGTWNFDAGYTTLIPVAVGTSSRLAFWQVGDNVAEVVGIGVSALTSGTSDIGRMTITYFV